MLPARAIPPTHARAEYFTYDRRGPAQRLRANGRGESGLAACTRHLSKLDATSTN